MGWWQTGKEWITSVYNNETVAQVTKSIGSFTYKTIQNVFELGSTILPVITSIAETRVRNVVKNLAHMVWEDVLPYVLITYTADLIQRQGQQYLDDNKNPALVSVDTALQLGLATLQLATWIYKTRASTQLAVRMAVLAVEANSASKTINKNDFSEIYKEKKSNSMRFLKGEIRHQGEFWGTEAAIALIGYVPIVGGSVSALLGIYHRGRYIQTIVLPDLCNQEQIEYLAEYPERALALGLAHFSLTKITTMGIEYLTNIPLSYLNLDNISPLTYEPFVRQAMLFTTTLAAASSKLPPAVLESKRHRYDPVALYQTFIGEFIDIFALGLKKKLPKYLKQPPSDIDWGAILHQANAVWEHEYAQKIKVILLPPLLQSRDGFIKDRVIAPNFNSLRQDLIVAIESVETIQKKYAVRVAVKDPSTTAKTLWLIFGTPKALTKLFLSLMGNEKYMEELGKLRRKLEGMNPNGIVTLVDEAPVLQLRRDEVKVEEIIEPIEEQEGDKVAAQDVIQRLPPANLVNVAAIIEKKEPQREVPLKAVNVIQRRNNVFFGNKAAAVIQLRHRKEEVQPPPPNPTVANGDVEELTFTM